ncbi:MAG: hypothetical protein PHP50_11865 [Lachnospiraceae bacterium]|nr:hypothetical protein [Lachnospiraceae bacterium]
MAVFNIDGELKPEAKDVLYEIGNVGVGTAIIPIGNIREMEIKINTPKVVTTEKNLLEELSYDPNQIVVGVTTKMNDTFDGSILFMLSREFVHNMVNIMTDEDFDDEQLLKNEDSISAIQEMINYMTAGYAKVIGAYLNVPVFISAASLGMDKVKNVVDAVMNREGVKVDRIAYVNTEFTIIDEAGKKTDEVGQVLIFPDEKCIEAFIEIMGE